MALKVKLKDLILSNNSLLELGELTEIPAGTGFRVARAIRKTRDELRGYHDSQMKILKDTGKATAHPAMPGAMWLDPAKVTPEELEAANAAVEALGEEMVEIAVNQIRLNEFGQAKLKPTWLADLDWLIIE